MEQTAAGLEEAIQVARQAVETTPEDHPNRAGWLNNLGNRLSNRYSRTRAMADLEEAIQTGRQAVEATPEDHPNRVVILNNLGLHLGNRYSRTGAMADLEEAIQIARQAVEATPENHLDRAAILNNLGLHLGDRYSRTGGMADLEEAIQSARQAVEATPEDHPDHAGWLNNLGLQLGNRYSRTGIMADLEEAIQIARQAVEATPENHLDRAAILNNLGLHLGDRYSRTGGMADLEEAIQIARQAVEATPEDHPGRAGRLNNLGTLFGDRHSRTGTMADLEEAIQIARQAVEATPEDHHDRAGWLNNLGAFLNNRYSRTGVMADLEEAIQSGRQAVEATPEDHPDRAGRLNNLGTQLSNRYSRTGTMADLEEAIQIARQAVEATPEDHPYRAAILSNLGIRLGNRYSRTGGMVDLEEAIQIARQAVEATPEDHPGRAGRLNNLGLELGNRYSRTGAMADLEEAIQSGRQAVEATPEDHPDRAGRLNNLGTQLSNRYSRTGTMADLEEAIQIARQAVEATPENHLDRAAILNNLGLHLGDRYSRTGGMADLEEAIQIARQAVEATPEDHPGRAGWLNNFGTLFGDRYSRTGAMADLEEALQLSLTALNLQGSPINERIRAGRTLLSSPRIFQSPQKACGIAETTISLVRLLAPQSLQNTDKEHLLSQAAGLGSDAAAVMLQAGRGAFAAIQMLETSCGVLMGSLYDLRTDVSGLEKRHPDLARTFISLRARLDGPAFRSPLQATAEGPLRTAQREGDQRREAAAQLEIVVQEIRGLPGFERFLLPPSEAEVCRAAEHGPIVVVNASSHRCDALIVDHSGIRSAGLPQLSRQDLERKESQSLDTLVWLWDTIVGPVLVELGLTQVAVDSAPQHVWWIPIGPLVRFPLHAAGDHLSGHRDTALDRIVSSYSSSIRAIMHGRQQRLASPTGGQQVALVAMENTPGVGCLDFAGEEIDRVRAVCESMRIKPLQPKLCREEVLSALQTCSMFHFAGHGSTHPANPLQSQLLLQDWEKDPFTVASLLETNLGTGSPFLAYLSACGTGQVLNNELINEGIHLTAAYQLAGFRHVIGTLWSVDDRLCVDMARMVYEFLQIEGVQNSGMSDEAVSRALHHAMRALRDEWRTQMEGGSNVSRQVTRDERDAVMDDVEVGKVAALWVPYVHFGV
ncbi:CHAT domain-containing protein [Apiospora arundinis]|uniref:CHAT domain-containing protein n=1 Tax=Apiospora arundinis TaxID=335852 RepID=A0ABR2HZ50_9PEZI